MHSAYRLSGRQRKQYAVRRGVIRVAIPLPLDWPDQSTDGQLREFVTMNLPGEILMPAHLRAVEETLIAIVPNGADPFGTIIGDEQARSTCHLTVSVVIATISFDEDPRHSNAQMQWPDLSLVFARAKRAPDDGDES